MKSPFIPGVWVAVISHLRAHHVAPMGRLIGPATWYVPRGQRAQYAAAGAPGIVEVDGMLIAQRNAALADGWGRGLPVVMLDDDLKRIKQATPQPGGKFKAVPIAPTRALATMVERLAASGAYLGGVPPTSNLFYYGGRPIAESKWCIASLNIVRPCGLFFKEEFRLKEDYDYTCQHLLKYGRVCRNEDMLCEFNHYSAPGGCTPYRTAEREEEVCRRLLAAWPRHLRRNPRRAHEVILKWKT